MMLVAFWRTLVTIVVVFQHKQVASGKWQVASGKWQVASGKWQVASGKWQVASGNLAYGSCARSTSGSQNLAVLPKRRKGEEDYFPQKLRVRIKDHKNSPHGKFHRFLFPFSSKFSDLNFASYVLYNFNTRVMSRVTHSEPGLPMVRLPFKNFCKVAKRAETTRNYRFWL